MNHLSNCLFVGHFHPFSNAKRVASLKHMLFDVVCWGQQSGNLEGGGLLHNVVDMVSMDREESIMVTTL